MKIQGKKEVELKGKVIYATSQTHHNPAVSIYFGERPSSSDGINWLSDRRGCFPQELGFRLHRNSHVTSLWLTCPAYFCPSKIEVYSASLISSSATVPRDIDEAWEEYKQAVFTKIGDLEVFLPMEDLKKHDDKTHTHVITVDSPGVVFISLLLHEAIPSRKNLHHQVSVSSIQFFGAYEDNGQDFQSSPVDSSDDLHDVADVLKDLGLGTEFTEAFNFDTEVSNVLMKTTKTSSPGELIGKSSMVVVGTSMKEGEVHPQSGGQPVYSHSWAAGVAPDPLVDADLAYFSNEGWGREEALYCGPPLFAKEEDGQGNVIQQNEAQVPIEMELWKLLGPDFFADTKFPLAHLVVSLDSYKDCIEDVIGWVTVRVLLQSRSDTKVAVFDVIEENLVDFIEGYGDNQQGKQDTARSPSPEEKIRRADVCFHAACILAAHGLSESSPAVLCNVLHLICSIFAGGDTKDPVYLMTHTLPPGSLSWSMHLLLPLLARRVVSPPQKKAKKESSTSSLSSNKGSSKSLGSPGQGEQEGNSGPPITAKSVVLYLSGQSLIGPSLVASVLGKITRTDLQPLRWVVVAGKIKCLAALVQHWGLIDDSVLDLKDLMLIAVTGMNHDHEKVRSAAFELVMEVYFVVGRETVLKYIKGLSPRDLAQLQQNFGAMEKKVSEAVQKQKTPTSRNSNLPGPYFGPKDSHTKSSPSPLQARSEKLGNSPSPSLLSTSGHGAGSGGLKRSSAGSVGSYGSGMYKQSFSPSPSLLSSGGLRGGFVEGFQADGVLPPQLKRKRAQESRSVQALFSHVPKFKLKKERERKEKLEQEKRDRENQERERLEAEAEAERQRQLAKEHEAQKQKEEVHEDASLFSGTESLDQVEETKEEKVEGQQYLPSSSSPLEEDSLVSDGLDSSKDSSNQIFEANEEEKSTGVSNQVSDNMKEEESDEVLKGNLSSSAVQKVEETKVTQFECEKEDKNELKEDTGVGGSSINNVTEPRSEKIDQVGSDRDNEAPKEVTVKKKKRCVVS